MNPIYTEFIATDPKNICEIYVNVGKEKRVKMEAYLVILYINQKF